MTLCCRVADKGTIFSIKLSLDLKIVAIQRTATATAVVSRWRFLESRGPSILLFQIFINIVNGAAETVEYAQTCKGKANRIIGIEWISGNEIVFITDHGLELYQVCIALYGNEVPVGVGPRFCWDPQKGTALYAGIL